MADYVKAADFFAAWKRMCQEQHGACRGCPLYGDATGSIFTCLRYAFEQPAEAIRIVQEWADAHPATTWEDKLRELLPSAKIAAVMHHVCPGEIFGEAAPARPACRDQEDMLCASCWQREYVGGE